MWMCIVLGMVWCKAFEIADFPSDSFNSIRYSVAIIASRWHDAALQRSDHTLLLMHSLEYQLQDALSFLFHLRTPSLVGSLIASGRDRSLNPKY
jgi:hypothetical protein